MTEAEREAFEEKAAIIEFDSGLVDHIQDPDERWAEAERIAGQPGMIIDQGYGQAETD